MANNLKKLLQHNGFTAAELMVESELSSTTIDKVVNNRKGSSVVTMVKIREAFNRLIEKKAKRLGHSEYTTFTIKDIFPDYEV